MAMDGDDVDSGGAKRGEDRRHLVVEHGDVARDHRVLVASEERRPGVEAHPRIDDGAVLAQIDVGTADGDLVDRSGLFSRMADDPGEGGGVERRRRGRG